MSTGAATWYDRGVGIRDTFRRWIRWLTLLVLTGLACLSVVGAFLGTQRATRLFNSPPMAGVWGLTALLLLMAGVATLARRRWGLAAMHIGALLVIVGGLWASTGVQQLRTQWGRMTEPTCVPPPREGYMLLHAHRPGRLLLEPIAGGELYAPFDELPLSVELLGAEIEYYPNDRPNTPPVVRDYLATLRVTRDGELLAEKTLEVNHPLHAGGYQFTLSQLDLRRGTVLLQVVSDRGWGLVHAGFLLVLAGAFVHYWLGPIWRRWATRRDRR